MILVNLSNLVWAPARWRRNQAIFSHLLLGSDRFEEGVFIQPPIAQSKGAFSFYSPPKLETVSRPGDCGRPVTVLQPTFSLPGLATEKAIRKSAAALAEQLVQEQLRKRPFLLWINSVAHYQGHLAEHLLPFAEFRVFDSGESLLMYERTENATRLKQQRQILQAADAVLCVNQHVMTKIAHPMKKVFSNCTEFAERQQPHADFRMPPLFPKPTGTVYIGFVGMISADRVDIDLLHSLFTRFTSFQFIFVGSTNKPSLLARLKTYPNFHFVPEVPHADLAPIIHSFDAAIVPHLDNDSTRGADLPTVLDYLACGVPVVSTATLNVESYGKAVYMAKSMWEFGNLLERVVSGDITHNPTPGREIARVRSWSQSVPELMDWLFQRLPAAS